MVKRLTSLLLIALTSFSIFGIGFSSWLIVEDITDSVEIPLVVPEVELFLTLSQVNQNLMLTDVGFQTADYEIKDEGFLNFDLIFKNAEARDSGDVFIGDVATFNTRLLALNENAYSMLSSDYFSISINKSYDGTTTTVASGDVNIDNSLHQVVSLIPITFGSESLATFSIRYDFSINDIAAYKADFANRDNEPFRFQFSIETIIHEVAP